MRDSQTFKVGKEQLLTILRANREKHLAEYTAAFAEFRKQAIEALSAELAKARDGKPFKLNLRLVRPKSFTSKYDEVEGLLTLSSQTEVDLTFEDYRGFVLDKWDWTRVFREANATYLGKLSADPDGEDD